MSEEKKLDRGDSFVIGLIVGAAVVTVIALLAQSDLNEEIINQGYWEHNKKIYTVTLFDTLETPKEPSP